MNKHRYILSIVFVLMLFLSLCTPALAYDMGKVGERSIISAGNNQAAAVDQRGALWTWGYNRYGQLGDGTTENSSVPIKVLDSVTAISYGDFHTAVIKTDSSLWIWGEGTGGKLGNGSTIGVYPKPVEVMDNVAAVSCGSQHTAAIKTDGSLWMWGYNRYGELGNGGQGNDTDTAGLPIQTVPVKVMDGVAAVSCGGSYTAAIKTDDSLWMWGYNQDGELGNGGQGNATDPYGNLLQTVPVKVLDDVVAVSCGGGCTAAIKTDGSLWMWGANPYGQLGNGTTENSLVPIKVLDNVATVSCGWGYTAAVKTDDSLWMWGFSLDGQLGNGGQGNATDTVGLPIQTVPVKVLDNVAAVSCGNGHTVAVKADGSFWTWGYNGFGAVGNGGSEDFETVPIQITLGDGSSLPEGDNDVPTTTDVSDYTDTPTTTGMPANTDTVVGAEDKDSIPVFGSGFPVAPVVTSIVVIVAIVAAVLVLMKKTP